MNMAKLVLLAAVLCTIIFENFVLAAKFVC